MFYTNVSLLFGLNIAEFKNNQKIQPPRKHTETNNSSNFSTFFVIHNCVLQFLITTYIGKQMGRKWLVNLISLNFSKATSCSRLCLFGGTNRSSMFLIIKSHFWSSLIILFLDFRKPLSFPEFMYIYFSKIEILPWKLIKMNKFYFLKNVNLKMNLMKVFRM